MTKTRTAQQQAVVDDLAKQYKVDTEGILFLNSAKPLEPWLPYDVLEAIARQSGRFQSIEEHYISYIEPLKQVVHSATVTDPEGRSYTRSGAATVGEKLPNEEKADEHRLAGARALNAALGAAGFNPLKAGSAVLDLHLASVEHEAADQSHARIVDLKQIHLLAAQKGLIRPREDDPTKNDMRAYRDWLAENFDGTDTAAALTPAQRAIAINMLREYQPPSAVAA